MVHFAESMSAPIREISNHENERGRARGDLRLDRPHPDITGLVRDVALDKDREIGAPGRRGGVEGVVGPAADGVVVEGVFLEPGKLRFPERPGRGERDRIRRRGGHALGVYRRRAVTNEVLAAHPFKGNRVLTGHGPVDFGTSDRRCDHGDDAGVGRRVGETHGVRHRKAGGVSAGRVEYDRARVLYDLVGGATPKIP